MNRRQEGSSDLVGASAVLASISAVVLVGVAMATDRPVLLGVAALVVAAAITLVVVRRSTSRRFLGPTSEPADGSPDVPGPAGGVGADLADGPDVDHETDVDGSAERYRHEAVAARADLLATLRHGFHTEIDPDGSSPDGPTTTDRQSVTGDKDDAPLVPDASFDDLPTATPDSSGSSGQGDDVPDALFDPATGLFTQGFFEASLPKRVSAARRGLRPLSLAVIDVVVGRPVAQATAADRAVVAEAMVEVFRDADTIAIAEDGRFLVLLEDTPEAGTVWTLERLRRHLTAADPDHTMWAGVSCYPAYSFDADGLIAQAREALESARQWQQDRIEIAAHAAE